MSVVLLGWIPESFGEGGVATALEQIGGVAFTPTPCCILFTFLGDVSESAL